MHVQTAGLRAAVRPTSIATGATGISSAVPTANTGTKGVAIAKRLAVMLLCCFTGIVPFSVRAIEYVQADSCIFVCGIRSGRIL